MSVSPESRRLVSDLIHAAYARNRAAPSTPTNEVESLIGDVVVAKSKLVERARRLGGSSVQALYLATGLSLSGSLAGSGRLRYEREALEWLETLEAQQRERAA